MRLRKPGSLVAKAPPPSRIEFSSENYPGLEFPSSMGETIGILTFQQTNKMTPAR